MLIAASLGLALDAAPASAHVEKNVGGYRLEVGWRDEPVYTDTANAVTVMIHDAKGKPVADIGNGLHVTVKYGGLATEPLALIPSFDADSGSGTPGLFAATIVPTQVGDYSFRLAGAINGTPIDETITSGPDTFNAVELSEQVMFPTKDQTPAQLTESVARLRAALESTRANARSATVFGEAGIAIGVAVGLSGASFVVVTRRKRSSAPAEMVPLPSESAA